MHAYDAYRFEKAAIGIGVSLEFFEAHLNNSNGAPTMSDEDVKATILHLSYAMKDIQDLFESMATDFEPQPKKPFWKKLLRK